MSNTIFSKCIGTNNYDKIITLECGLDAIQGRPLSMTAINRATFIFPNGWKYLILQKHIYKVYKSTIDRAIYCGHIDESNLKICNKYVLIKIDENGIVTQAHTINKGIIECLLNQ